MVAQRALLQDLHRALVHDVEPVARVPLPEQELSRLQLPGHGQGGDALQVGSGQPLEQRDPPEDLDRVARGRVWTHALASNATTGFQWGDAGM